MDWLQSDTVKSLLHICVESAQQILRILSDLLEQGLLGELFACYPKRRLPDSNNLLDSFLPFDIDAAFTATISLLIAAAIDPSLLHDHCPWSQRAYTILDDMTSRGNMYAKYILSELKQLDGQLAQLSMQDNMAMAPNHLTSASGPGNEPASMMPSLASGYTTKSLEIDFSESFGEHYELSPGQLLDLANSLDLNSLSWPLPSMEDFAGHEV
ncbi:hypothetical protein FE257_001311 [Aspergillus nanangensis]|uniref:Uncharacterized protein n=1 Tax=Aspergillus nanangensis TaxID=2582783 RepID=A0AAD4CE07_ASPNN|nr:hypothetical protein FE257_001311 [Aspergillus nanangensis]